MSAGAYTIWPPPAPRRSPSGALDRLKALYGVETEICGLEADTRRALRQERFLPVIQELEHWLRAKLETISQKTELAEAIRYALLALRRASSC